MRDNLIEEAERIEEDLLWSQTAHFQMATFWRSMHWCLGIPTVVLTAVTGLAAVKATHPDLIVSCAIASAIFSALLTFLNPQKSAREAHGSGVRYSVLRARVRRFRELDLHGADLPRNARQELEKLADQKGHLMETTPHTGGLGYWFARLSIRRKQHIHAADKTKRPATSVT